jgi:hypothetical protein
MLAIGFDYVLVLPSFFKRLSERDDFVLDLLALLDPVNRPECGTFPIKRHAAERVQFRHERQRNRMVDEIVAADPAAIQGQQVAMEAADDGREVAGVLYGIGVGCGVLLNRIGSVGDGHDLLLGFGSRNKRVSVWMDIG